MSALTPPPERVQKESHGVNGGRSFQRRESAFFMTRIANNAEEQSHKKNAVIFEKASA